jgi:hypothetical protein
VAAGVSARLPISYVLPLRMVDAQPRAELAAYLRQLIGWVDDVIVVDGSEPELFDGNAAAWPAGVRQRAPALAYRCLNRKVAGVHTGVEQARHEHVVLADDDVRYEERPQLRASAPASTSNRTTSADSLVGAWLTVLPRRRCAARRAAGVDRARPRVAAWGSRSPPASRRAVRAARRSRSWPAPSPALAGLGRCP